MIDEAAYDQAVQDCFTGDMCRDCSNCVASPAYGGRCCFGEAYNVADRECRDCYHRSECSQVYHGVARRPAQVTIRRPIVTSGQPLIGPRHAPVSNITARAVPLPSRSQGALLPTAVHRTPPVPVKEEVQVREPFLKRLGRVAGWGAVEGGLQMMLNFFQRNRPE